MFSSSSLAPILQLLRYPRSSYVDVMRECNSFPALWTFCLPNPKSDFCTIRKFREDILLASLFDFVEDAKELRLLHKYYANPTKASETFKMIRSRAECLPGKFFGDLDQFSDRLLPVWGSYHFFGIPYDIAGIFDIVTSSIHMTIYTGKGADMKIWVARRGKNKTAYPGMLDQCVSGGIDTRAGNLLKVIRREAKEEANLGSDMKDVLPVNKISFLNIRPPQAGPVDAGRPEPGVRWVFEFEVGDDVRLETNERDMEGFERMTLDQVNEALLGKEFKPDCGLVMLDFMLRHGHIHVDHPEYKEIVAMMQRKTAVS
ncbi:hypothetical protein B0H66DRAFT_608142 [Apodospora peruviana]|uniref:Nudix hydrolase domain-containing protein n=1 Tax=Apodospora peruviana TaxID=516989 RepID=A0AAE0LZY5_9PEZI|nr:hypothetical protein B0H66DRAFT_608142 [Apodospora peruviana]